MTAVVKVALPLILGMASFVVTLCPDGCRVPILPWPSSAGDAMNPSLRIVGLDVDEGEHVIIGLLGLKATVEGSILMDQDRESEGVWVRGTWS